MAATSSRHKLLLPANSIPLSGKSTYNKLEGSTMQEILLKLCARFHNLRCDEEGQDLVEYALLVCLIALAAISGVNMVASAVTTVFSNISSSLA
jgi:pilus assembly protein Flp/PilA